MNTLGKEMQAECEEVMNQTINNPAYKAVVLISGKPGSFIAGADIG
jgi:enoyl-CoA hydratase/carnithine racemase